MWLTPPAMPRVLEWDMAMGADSTQDSEIRQLLLKAYKAPLSPSQQAVCEAEHMLIRAWLSFLYWP
jgi:hypothetical protein